jgi:hypothetical protein
MEVAADRLFATIDTDKNGSLSQEELLVYLLGAGVEHEEIARIFAALDTNSDGAAAAACTTREVTMMFVMVNMDDETYIQNATHVGGRAANGSAAAGSPTKRRVARTDTSAELDFDEFLEIMVRICNEKLPKPRDGPFEQSLNRWLGATLVPALLAASKARKLTGGV